MDQYESIRTLHRVYEKSIRDIARQTGHHRETIRKAIAGKEPKYRRKKPVRNPVMDPVAAIIEKWLEEDQNRPRKQRHTAHRVYERLVEEHGFEGAESTVRRWVREYTAGQGYTGIEAVVLLDPEAARQAEVDWGTAWVVMAGEQRQVKLFCMRSRYSGKPYVRAYPWERQEMFFDAHMRAFTYFGGVFEEIVYDNLTTAVKKILRGKKRIEQESFVCFRSHYTFRARFCSPARGQEKGGVEGLIGYARRNFLVPLPEVENFAQLNRLLEQRCRQHDQRRIGGREDRRTIGQRHQTEQCRLIRLPETAYENSRPVRVKIDRYQTARLDGNRYSVPRAYVGRWLWADVGCERIDLYAQHRQVASHQRVFSAGQWQLDPLHYLSLIRQRIGAFEAARPIRQWRAQWPEQYEVLLAGLRRNRGETAGTREFVKVLQLHTDYPCRQVEEAIAQVVSLGAFDSAAVKQLWVQSERCLPPTRLPADFIPGLTDRTVAVTDLSRYDDLLVGGGR
jgi:transposase